MKRVRSRAGKAGLPPGSLVHVTDEGPGTGSVRAFVYDPDSYTETMSPDLMALQLPPPRGMVCWIDVDGLHDGRTVSAVGDRFGLHPLLLEDVLNTDQRPKLEEYRDDLFVVVKMLSLDDDTGAIEAEQVSLVLGRGHVISFQERPGDVLDPVRDRIRQGLGRVRKGGADYLLYSLLDVIVDNYFLVVEDLGRRIERLERKVTVRPGNEDLLGLQELRSLLITLNRHVTPTRELAGRLNSLQSPLIEESTRRYINDLQDHMVYIAESIATFRDMLSSLENTYHAGVNLRMGQVIKLLTIISTIFIPLTFIVGVYGMNFRHMPELEWRYGYFAVMAAMALIAAGMLLWFRRRRWL